MPQRKVEEEEEGPILEEEPSSQSIDEKEAKEVPELEDSPPPSINVVTPSIRSGLRIKSDVSSVCSLEESQGLSQEASEELEANQYTGTEETCTSHDLGGDGVNEMESEVIRNDVEDKQMEVETDVLSAVQEALPQEEFDVVEEMTVIDEVTGDGEQEDKAVATGVCDVAQQSGDGVSGDVRFMFLFVVWTVHVLWLGLLVTYPHSALYNNPRNLCSTFPIIEHFVLGLGNALFLLLHIMFF